MDLNAKEYDLPSLAEEEKKSITQFLDSIIDNVEKLEFYASVLYIHREMVFWKEERNPEGYENKIKEAKPGLYQKKLRS